MKRSQEWDDQHSHSRRNSVQSSTQKRNSYDVTSSSHTLSSEDHPELIYHCYESRSYSQAQLLLIVEDTQPMAFYLDVSPLSR